MQKGDSGQQVETASVRVNDEAPLSLRRPDTAEQSFLTADGASHALTQEERRIERPGVFADHL